MGGDCSPGVGEEEAAGDLRGACNARGFPVPPAIFDENGAYRRLGHNGPPKIGDASHLA
jgi:hypothetical protein